MNTELSDDSYELTVRSGPVELKVRGFEEVGEFLEAYIEVKQARLAKKEPAP